MARLASHVLMDACRHGLFNLNVTVLAGGFALDVSHAFRPGLVAVSASDLFDHMYVFGQSRRLGEFLAEVTVPTSPLHGPGMAHKGAPPSAAAARCWRYPSEGMHSLLARGCIVAVKAARMADIACLLLGHCLFMGHREIDLLNDLLRIFEGEPVSFRPADRLGVREGRTSVVRSVNIVPDLHGPLPEVRAHDTCVELLHLIRVTG
jgi:hypothetical protein